MADTILDKALRRRQSAEPSEEAAAVQPRLGNCRRRASEENNADICAGGAPAVFSALTKNADSAEAAAAYIFFAAVHVVSIQFKLKEKGENSANAL